MSTNYVRSHPAKRCHECGCPERTTHFTRGPVCDGCGADWPVFEA